MKTVTVFGKVVADCAYFLAIALYTLLTALVLGRKAWSKSRGSVTEDPLEG